jgi:hypothetical protein
MAVRNSKTAVLGLILIAYPKSDRSVSVLSSAHALTFYP